MRRFFVGFLAVLLAQTAAVGQTLGCAKVGIAGAR